MSKILFENKKVALGFAGAVIVGTAGFAAVSGMSGPAAQSDEPPYEEIVEGEAQNGDGADEEKASEEQIEFAADEALIDDTGGFDPSPSGGEIPEGEEASKEKADERDRNQRHTGAKDDERPSFDRDDRGGDDNRGFDDDYAEDDYGFSYDDEDYDY